MEIMGIERLTVESTEEFVADKYRCCVAAMAIEDSDEDRSVGDLDEAVILDRCVAWTTA